jgi:hypothetical protein
MCNITGEAARRKCVVGSWESLGVRRYEDGHRLWELKNEEQEGI